MGETGKGRTKGTIRTGIQYITRGLVCLILAIYGLLPVFVSPALAATEDIELDIKDTIVCRNLAQSGDMLFVVHYEISWDAEEDYPDDPSDDTILVQLIETEQSVSMAATTPYPFYNSGYSEQVSSFYFSPTLVAALSMVWEEPFMFRIATEPGFIATPVTEEWVLSDGDYVSSADQQENRDELADWLFEVAQDLETDWGVSASLTTVSVTDVLSDLGEQYFGRVIPGLRDMCPDIFTVTWGPGSFDETEWTMDKQEALKEQWDGEDNFVENALDGLDDLFSDSGMFTTFAALGFVLFTMMISFRMFTNARPGLLLGLLILPFGARLGFVDAVIMGLIAFLFILYIGNQLLLQRAN